MKTNILKATPCLIALLAASGGIPAWAQMSDLDQLKATMQQMQKTMQEMQKKIDELEREKARSVTTNIFSATSPSVKTIEKVSTGEQVGHASPVADRSAMRDYQEGAPRPKDYTLDPKYRGFIPVPNTGVLVK